LPFQREAYDIATYGENEFRGLPREAIHSVNLGCGDMPLRAGQAGCDTRERRPQTRELSDPGSYWCLMDSLEFMVLRCPPDINEILMIHGPEHYTRSRLAAILAVGWEKLRSGGRFVVEFPDFSKVATKAGGRLTLEARQGVLGGCSPYSPEHLSIWDEHEMVCFLGEAATWASILVSETGHCHGRPDRDTQVIAIK